MPKCDGIASLTLGGSTRHYDERLADRKKGHRKEVRFDGCGIFEVVRKKADYCYNFRSQRRLVLIRKSKLYITETRQQDT